MSTEYLFVKEQRRKEAERLSDIMQEISSHCEQTLTAAQEKLPEMLENIDAIKFELAAAIRKCRPERYVESEVIGTSTYSRFEWRLDNGLHDINTVEKFLSGHPGYSIEDEYGTTIPLVEFKKIVQK